MGSYTWRRFSEVRYMAERVNTAVAIDFALTVISDMNVGKVRSVSAARELTSESGLSIIDGC